MVKGLRADMSSMPFVHTLRCSRLSSPFRFCGADSKPVERVLDPFCGRSTTNFAARLTGLYSVGATQALSRRLSQAKLVSPTAEAIEKELAGDYPSRRAAGDPTRLRVLATSLPSYGTGRPLQIAIGAKRRL